LDSTGKIASSFVLGSPYSFVRFKTFAGGNIFGENFNFGYGLIAGGNEL
jgi:hypothetical protein